MTMERLKGPRTGGLLALALVLAILPLFLPNTFYFEVAVKALLNAMVCVGLNLLIGYAGQISLGHAGFLGIGAYASAILTATYGWPPLAAMGIGAGAAGALAFLVARPVLKLKGHYLAMATLGLGIIIAIVINSEADLTGGPDGMSLGGLSLFGLKVKGEKAWYALVAILLLVAVWLALNLIQSPIGRALRAIHSSEVGAQVVGVDTTRYKVLIFTLSAILASVSGSLWAHYSGFVSPTGVGFIKSIELVTMVVLGGMASTYGAVVGAAVLTVLPELLTALHDYEHMVFGGIMMLTMIFMPKGLVPTVAAAFAGRKAKGGDGS